MKNNSFSLGMKINELTLKNAFMTWKLPKMLIKTNKNVIK